MRAKIKRSIASLLVMILMITSLSITVFANTSGVGGVGDKDNSGSGQGGGAVNSAYTWDTNQSGYRFTIINENFEPVSNTVDLLFNNPSQLTNPADRYTNSRATSLSSDNSKWKLVTIDELYKSEEFKGAKYPPVPIKFITVNGKTASQAQGQAFKEWFLSGKGSITSPTVSTGQGLSVTTPNNNSSGSYNYGTTKPVKKEAIPIEDLGYVSVSMLKYSSNYRGIKHSEAMSKTIEQGYYEHARSIVNSLKKTIESIVSFRAMKENKSISEIKEEEVLRQWEYFSKIGKSYAETVYMYTAIIREVLGVDWTPTPWVPSIDETLMSLKGISSIVIASKELLLEQIPLASESNNEGYALKFLNYEMSNKFLFNLIGTDKSKGKYVTDVMIENNYSIIVEPIFWFVPAASNSSGLPTSPIHSNYVYGTVGNLIEFSRNYGYKYGASGGAYGTLLGSLGWRSMYLGEDWLGNGVTIKGYSELVGKKGLSELNSMLGSNQGIAMHIYVTDVTDSLQSTRDFSKGDIPHEAPDPSSLAEPTGDTKKYKIVKYYEQELSDGTVDRQKFITTANPPSIKIDDEISYKVKEWFITASESNGEADYISSKSILSSTREGIKAENVRLSNGEMSLHLLLVKKPTVVSSTGLNLGESEISKAITTMDTGINNWGPRTFTFNYASMAGSDVHYCGGCRTDSDGDSYCPGHQCNAQFGDSTYRYIIGNSSAIDNILEANGAGGVFASRLVNNVESGSANLGGGTNRIEDAEYQTVIWRGLDVPTIASYKEDSSNPLRGLLNKYGKAPVGNRATNGVYKKNLTIQLNVANESDLNTHSVHSYTGNIFKLAQHSYNNVESHSGELNINVFRGSNSKSSGNETIKNEVQTITPFGWATSINSAGYMIQQSTPIQFYPYIRMTYQTTGSSVKHDVNVLSQFYSEILPNDFAEAAWYNVNENESLLLSSTQWSLHAKAINGGQPWNGRNQVLPGGAIYQLSTGEAPTKVALVTWQTIVESDIRNMIYNTLPSNEYTLGKANAEHKVFVDQAKLLIENLRIVQWVNGDANATNAWTNNGRAVKITGGGENLSPLGLSGTTSSEAKYHLKGDSATDAANEGDLDIIRSVDSQDVYFKVFANTSGDIYLAKSIGDIESLRRINGTNLHGSGAVTVTKILSKNDTIADIDNKLTGDAKELNDRTLIVQNIAMSLERNKGMDMGASWVTDGRWYNESMDGIVVVRKSTILDVGFNKPGVRTSVLDPKITPPSNGQSDMFNRVHLSQFRVDSKSTASIAQNKPNGYIGTFKNKDISLKDVENIYVSKKFYIPNVVVSDLR